MNYKDVIKHLTERLHRIEGKENDPENEAPWTAYDDGYLDALEYAMVTIEEMLGEPE